MSNFELGYTLMLCGVVVILSNFVFRTSTHIVSPTTNDSVFVLGLIMAMSGLLLVVFENDVWSKQ